MLNISQMKIQEPIARWPELAGKKDLDISEELICIQLHTPFETFIFQRRFCLGTVGIYVKGGIR